MSENEKYTPPEAKKNIISLTDLFDPQQDTSRYAGLIARQERELTRGNLAVLNSTEYSERWDFLVSQSAEKYLQQYTALEGYKYIKNHYETLDLLLRNHLRNSVLIDLGSGGGHYVKQIAYKYKVCTYIGVDRGGEHEYGKILPDPQTAIEDVQSDDLQRMKVRSDMLDFIARLRLNTLNFTLNGIDRIIIDNIGYHEALAQELLRVAQKGSLIFGVDSHALEILSEHAEAEDSKIKEYPIYELPEMDVGKGRLFEVIK